MTKECDVFCFIANYHETLQIRADSRKPKNTETAAYDIFSHNININITQLNLFDFTPYFRIVTHPLNKISLC